MILDIRNIPNDKILILKEEVNFDNEMYQNNTFFKKIDKCIVTLNSYFKSYLIVCDFVINVNIILNDDISLNKNKIKNFLIKDKIIFSNNKDDENNQSIEEIIIYNNKILLNLDDLIYSLIISNLPTKI